MRRIETSILYGVELDIEILKNEIGNTIGPSNILNAYELTWSVLSGNQKHKIQGFDGVCSLQI